jgi:nitroreductase
MGAARSPGLYLFLISTPKNSMRFILKSDPLAPAFGEPLPISAAPQTLGFLARRRSASALTLTEPGPSQIQIETLLTVAARVPDHGKLAPWRFVVLEGSQKAVFVARIEALIAARRDADSLKLKLGKLRAPPVTIAVISRHIEGKIPEWEQRLSAGAVCGQLLTAVQAMGFGGNWITDWYAYDPDALVLLGLVGEEKVAGFIHIGTPREAPLERVRPDMSALVTHWKP